MDNELPSRRYTCEVCGDKGRRGNKEHQRRLPPVCPRCEKHAANVALYAPSPELAHSYAYFPETNHALEFADEDSWSAFEDENEGCREDIPFIEYDSLAEMQKIYPRLTSIIKYDYEV